MKQTAIEKVDWFCPKCNSYVSSESVTFEETHQICKTGVILEPLNQNKMKDKISAVEWLVEQLKTMDTKSFNRLIQIEMSRENFEECFEQAKEMEKEHIIDAYERGWDMGVLPNDCNSEQYYNENFKSE